MWFFAKRVFKMFYKPTLVTADTDLLALISDGINRFFSGLP